MIAGIVGGVAFVGGFLVLAVVAAPGVPVWATVGVFTAVVAAEVHLETKSTMARLTPEFDAIAESDGGVTTAEGGSVDEHPARLVRPRVERLAAEYDLPTPEVRVVDAAVPNAAAAARSRSDAVVVVTLPLLKLLNEEQLNAILAHELAHIANRDAVIVTAASAVPAAVWRSHSRDKRGGPFGKVGLVILAPLVTIAAFFVGMFSFAREYAADDAATAVTGRPAALAGALERLAEHDDNAMSKRPDTDLREVGLPAVAWVVSTTTDTPFEALVNTHPPVDDRINRLLSETG